MRKYFLWLAVFGSCLGVLGFSFTEFPSEPRVIHADVVALEQPVFYNRFGSVNPYMMSFALARDVVEFVDGEEWLPGLACPGNYKMRDGKRPRPLVLRGNVGDILEIKLTNGFLDEQPDLSRCRLLDPNSPYSNLTLDEETFNETFGPGDAEPAEEREDVGVTAERDKRGNDWPYTRSVSLTIQGMTPEDGDNPKCTGLEAIDPGESITCRWQLSKKGTFLLYSNAAPAGGEGDGGGLVQGLFGTVNVEPENSKWYRSQVTQDDLDAAWPRASADGVRGGALEYEATYPNGDPILNMLKSSSVCELKDKACYELVYGDLNAIVFEDAPQRKNYSDDNTYLEALKEHTDAPAFREFTAIFHDELKKFYANPFTELETNFTLVGVGDGFGLNYGASGMGSILIANRKGIGPSWNCAECLYEEFFLQSWANGDPALLEQYRDDPSNVYHSYLNDRIHFRNLHAGPKETHVFHLHAHQWLSASDENKGSYLDSQTIGPLQGFEYEIYNGGLDNYEHSDQDHSAHANHEMSGENAHAETQGSGNRNRTPGDSIFHCHLYPHFAQGMWALWRVHDVLEDGSRTLPDGQPTAGLSFDVVDKTTAQPRLGTDAVTGVNLGGTPIPAVVPLPGQALPPLPTYGETGLAGYPFYIPGSAGHRAPQPPLDFAKDENGEWKDGGLPRHVFGDARRGLFGFSSGEVAAMGADEALKRGLALADFSGEIESADIRLLDNAGEKLERNAMAFHANSPTLDLDVDGTAENVTVNLKFANGQTYTLGDDILSLKPEDASAYSGASSTTMRFGVNGSPPKPGAPFADPCGSPASNTDREIFDLSDGQERYFPDPAMTTIGSGFRFYNVSAISLDMVVNEAGWHDPQARINVLDKDVPQFAFEDNKPKRTNEAEPFFFRAASGECIVFYHSNRTPKELERDDFQVRTPTDIIGQHIHLVKFDVTSSDGSGNGFNYEDGTLAPDAVHERKCAANNAGGAIVDDVGTRQQLETHGVTCPAEGVDHHEIFTDLLALEDAPGLAHRNTVQTTTQRWFADPILTVGRTPGAGMDGSMATMNHAGPALSKDRTLRTVFTHDHFAPSSIQQHGFYSALLIEPAGSTWLKENGEPLTDEQGQAVGPRAMIIAAKDNKTHPDHREFALAIADFALLYDPHISDELEEQGMGRLLCEAGVAKKYPLGMLEQFCPPDVLAVLQTEGVPNADGLADEDAQHLYEHATSYWAEHGRPVDPPHKPEAISKDHHNPYLVNYKNEPIPLRIGMNAPDNTDCGMNVMLSRFASITWQKDGEAGDLANVFRTTYQVDNDAFAGHGEPCTPIFEAYEGERVQVRLIQGAQEVQHMFTVEGLYWPRVVDYGITGIPAITDLYRKDNALAYVASQEIGISEHFEMALPPLYNIDSGLDVADYLYHFGTLDSLWNGAWGLLRSYDGVNTPDADGTGTIGERIAPLPNHPTGEAQNVLNEDSVFNGNIRDANGQRLELESEEFSDNGAAIRATCPSGSRFLRYTALAIRVDMLGQNQELLYDATATDAGAGLHDPDALILLPLESSHLASLGLDPLAEQLTWSEVQTYLQSVQKKLEPFVLRVNAGDCVELNVYNALGQLPEGKTGDERGDALMPKIVPLNVDQEEPHVEEVKETGEAQEAEEVEELEEPHSEENHRGDVRPSQKLSLSIPLVYTRLTNAALPVGRNDFATALEPAPLEDGEFFLGRETLRFYAGLVTYSPARSTADGKASCSGQRYEATDAGFCVRAAPYAFGTIPIKPFGDVLSHGVHGLFGAVIVEPLGSRLYQDVGDALQNVSAENAHTLGAEAVVRYPDFDVLNGKVFTHEFREFVLFYQDGLNLWTGQNVPVEDCRVCDDSYDLGERGVSYRSAPFWARLSQSESEFGAGSNLNQALFPNNFLTTKYRDIPTPTFTAREGEEVRFRVLQPAGRARQRSFTVYGYSYEDMMPEFGSPNAALMSVGKAITASLEPRARAGCYLYRDGPAQFFSGGVWGSFVVERNDGTTLTCK